MQVNASKIIDGLLSFTRVYYSSYFVLIEHMLVIKFIMRDRKYK